MEENSSNAQTSYCKAILQSHITCPWSAHSWMNLGNNHNYIYYIYISIYVLSNCLCGAHWKVLKGLCYGCPLALSQYFEKLYLSGLSNLSNKMLIAPFPGNVLLKMLGLVTQRFIICIPFSKRRGLPCCIPLHSAGALALLEAGCRKIFLRIEWSNKISFVNGGGESGIHSKERCSKLQKLKINYFKTVVFLWHCNLFSCWGFLERHRNNKRRGVQNDKGQTKCSLLRWKARLGD